MLYPFILIYFIRRKFASVGKIHTFRFGKRFASSRTPYVLLVILFSFYNLVKRKISILSRRVNFFVWEKNLKKTSTFLKIERVRGNLIVRHRRLPGHESAAVRQRRRRPVVVIWKYSPSPTPSVYTVIVSRPRLFPVVHEP